MRISAVFAMTLWLGMQAVVCEASGPMTHREANRVLEQGTWGPTQIPDPTLETKGLEAWFASQVNAPISTYSDQPLLDSKGNVNTNLAPVQIQFFQNALNNPDQLRQRVAFALSEIWVISELGISNATAFPPFFRTLQNDAFGNYEQLMNDVTLNPGMGRYLNMVNNSKATKTSSPNENYGREFMQLFTLGLTRLNIDGSPVLDTSGNPVPTYTQADVVAMSAALTGWTYAPPAGTTTTGDNPANYLARMVPVEAHHDTTAKTILGTTLPAGQTAEQDLANAIHIVFTQPTLPPFVCKQLIQHLVTSNPSPEYIARVSATFVDNGSGVRGDLKSVIYAILNDPEASNEQVVTRVGKFGHMREPVLLVLNLLRGLNGAVSSTSAAANGAANLGQQLFYPPSVFSYFSPQYCAPNDLLAPEFQLYSTQTAANRTDIVNSAIYSGQLDAGTKFDISSFTTAALAGNAQLLNLISYVFFRGIMSSQLSDAIGEALVPLTAAGDKAKAALYVALTSGEYQIIH